MFVGDSPFFFKVIRNMAADLLLAVGSAAVVVGLYSGLGFKEVSIPTTSITIVGAALSIFLAFRNNTAYDRYWEARKLWGALINQSRNLGRQVLSLVDAEPGDDVRAAQKRILYTHIAYVNALRTVLRDQPVLDELPPFLGEKDIALLKGEHNIPAAILQMQGENVRELFKRGWLSDLRWTSVDATLSELCNVQGGCERIKNTPLPRAYNYFTRLIVQVYTVVLPFGLVEHLGWRTPVLSVFVAFTFLVLERIGRLIEHPFGMKHNDLALSAMCRTIEINLRQRLGETELPAPVKPVDGILL